MNVSDRTKLLSEEVVKIQEEDLQQVMDDLGISLEDAKEMLHLIFHKKDGWGVEYTISDANTLKVYKHRKISFGQWCVK